MKKILITERQFDRILSRVTEETASKYIDNDDIDMSDIDMDGDGEAYFDTSSDYELIELGNDNYELNLFSPLDLDDDHDETDLIDELIDKGYSNKLIGDLRELERHDYDGELDISYSGYDNDYRDIWSLTDFLNTLMRNKVF